MDNPTSFLIIAAEAIVTGAGLVAFTTPSASARPVSRSSSLADNHMGGVSPVESNCSTAMILFGQLLVLGKQDVTQLAESAAHFNRLVDDIEDYTEKWSAQFPSASPYRESYVADTCRCRLGRDELPLLVNYTKSGTSLADPTWGGNGTRYLP
ncbi:hypothetical protein DL765_009449 [Monosporascus sp. GIB2]|nr:hypothetical protein DL765_009449 [Monosporascus sp. GIB2]